MIFKKGRGGGTIFRENVQTIFVSVSSAEFGRTFILINTIYSVQHYFHFLYKVLVFILLFDRYGSCYNHWSTRLKATQAFINLKHWIRRTWKKSVFQVQYWTFSNYENPVFMSSDHNKETILLENKYFLTSVLDLF